MVYVVSYDLNKSDKDYNDLYKVLKKYSYIHYLDSTWLIETSESSTQIYDKLKPYIDKNDYILVIQAQNNYWGWLPNDAWDWLKKAKF